MPLKSLCSLGREGDKKAPGRERGRLDKQDGAAADWQAAGSRGADCDPKDVARMVEDYVIEKKEDASSQQTLKSIT